MVGRKFELNVDEWKFVGHPFSAQTVSFTTACNVVFVLQVSFNFTPSTFVLVVCKNRGEELAQLVAWMMPNLALTDREGKGPNCKNWHFSRLGWVEFMLPLQMLQPNGIIKDTQ